PRGWRRSLPTKPPARWSPARDSGRRRSLAPRLWTVHRPWNGPDRSPGKASRSSRERHSKQVLAGPRRNTNRKIPPRNRVGTPRTLPQLTHHLVDLPRKLTQLTPTLNLNLFRQITST